jgi:hypothetical protein
MKLGTPATRAMIESIVPITPCRLLGEVSMIIQSSPAECPVSPAQVWARLATDVQERTIRLMAQLAFKLVAAQPPGQPGKESDDALSTDCPQDPPRPS